MHKIIVLCLMVFFLLPSTPIFSQIESGKVVSSHQEKKKKPKKPKKERIPRTDEDVKELPYIFIGAGTHYNGIVNQEVNTIYSQPLGLKKDEVGRMVPIAGISYKAVLGKGFYLSFGMDYSQSGEKFSWKATDSDSLLTYKNNYHLLSIPVGVDYIFGKKTQLIAGLGFAPNLTFGSKNITNVIDTEKNKSEIKTPIQDRMNDFNIMGYLHIGVQFRLAPGIYFYVLPEARFSMINTLNKQASYKRSFWQVGAQAGVSFRI